MSQELQAITAHAKIHNGILNPNDLNPNERILLDKYLGYKVRLLFPYAIVCTVAAYVYNTI